MENHDGYTPSKDVSSGVWKYPPKAKHQPGVPRWAWLVLVALVLLAIHHFTSF